MSTAHSAYGAASFSVLIPVFVGASLFAYGACSATGDSQSLGAGGDTSANAIGAGGKTPSQPTASGAGGLDLPATSGSSSDAGLSEDAACATSIDEAKLIPLSLFVTID